ncbi:MAG: DEAD/DEAH box helicase [Candidatus Schekmanbacteria bacterium]|nr:DEAD/DEAH box helicase [Candidatus Schekmanbacteria bacterium]
MYVLKLAKYADEDGQLNDPDDARFLRQRKWTSETILDFTGVEVVGEQFLNALLEGEGAETIRGRITGVGPSVEVAVARWADSRGRSRERVCHPAPTPASPGVPTAPPADHRYTAMRLVRRLEETLRSYLEGAFPLADPILVRARRLLLEQEAGGRLLAQQPFVETNARFATSARSYDELGLPPRVAGLFTRLAATPSGDAESNRTVLFPRFYVHQEEAFRRLLVEKRDLVVAAGTGSGKTECFLVPILGALYDEATARPESFAMPAVRALVLYPMNALVNDQLARLRLLFGDPAVAAAFREAGAGRVPRFGMYTGRTPYPGPRTAAKDADRVAPLLEHYLGLHEEVERRLRLLGRYPAKDLRRFYGEHECRREPCRSGPSAGQERTRHHWDRRLHTGEDDRELVTRHEMVHGTGSLPGGSPDILITSYSMLEYMLMRPFERPIFEQTRAWLAREESRLYLVVDEAHTYGGARGAEVAFLLRRLCARLGLREQPGRLRVVIASASLGDGTDAALAARRFAADLSGKAPDDFAVVNGKPEMPAPAQPGTRVEADALARLELDRLHEPRDGADLLDCLQPLFRCYGVKCPSAEESEVVRTLYGVLDGRPMVGQFLRETAGCALPIEPLAAKVFPGHPQALQALESLIVLGTLARSRQDSPSLMPVRVHAMFRALDGLHACINPCCSGRQAEPGKRAAVGRLYTAPRVQCESCEARVFELASCRSCGSAYLMAYVEPGRAGQPDFLWGEIEGGLERVYVLPSEPRYPDQMEEVRVHLRTGYLDPGCRFPDQHVGRFFLGPRGELPRCAMCQTRGSGRIFDFRTQGEGPFTALVETQLAEQPPQSRDESLPNRGRKVLVFSDGRQRAARLAPAIESTHARHLFRQVLALAARELAKEQRSGMHLLYPAVAWLGGNRGCDLFPSVDEVEWARHLRCVENRTLGEAIELFNRGRLRPTTSFAKSLFDELTDRYYSMPALGLATIEEDGDLANDLRIFDGFPDVGLDGEAIRALLHAWIRLHFERRTFRPDGAELGQLGEGWAVPVGIRAENVRHVLPGRFPDYLRRALAGDETAVGRVETWFQWLVRQSDLLLFTGDRYYLQPEGLSVKLRIDQGWLRCQDCGRLYAEGLDSVCPACLGGLVVADSSYLSARTGFYRSQVQRALEGRGLEPFGLSTAEHTAQLTGRSADGAFNKVEEYELRFQDLPIGRPIDVLSCTTTMEVGVDIGALAGVALRNVPPHPASYQQRAGRAGRRGRSIASVVTYAHGTSHDAQFFEHPEDMIGGPVRPPIVYVENQHVLARHVRAYLLQRFFHEQVPADAGSRTWVLFESLGTVEQFLSGEYPCALGRLEAWLGQNETRLREELRGWVPTFSFGSEMVIGGVAGTIERATQELMGQLRAALPVEEATRRDALAGLERETLERRLEELLLESLMSRAILPRYAFPMDVVGFWVSRPRRPGDPLWRRTFEYEPQRELQLALTEYAPGRTLTIDKRRFESAAIYSPYAPSLRPMLERRQPYAMCPACPFVSLKSSTGSLERCPCCGSGGLARGWFVTPPGFAPDIHARPELDRGGTITDSGRADRARLEVEDPPTRWDAVLYAGRLRLWNGPQALCAINRGPHGAGFRICPECGRAEPERASTLLRKGRSVEHRHPLEQGVICRGVACGPFYLGYRFPTDVLLLRLEVTPPVTLWTPGRPGFLGRAARVALTSLVEAVAIAASRELQIGEGELSGWWAPLPTHSAGQAQLYFYDLLPGGAGYARALGRAAGAVLAATELLLDACDCISSCYRCIRSYANHGLHASLDRHLALGLLRYIRAGVVPSVRPAEGRAALRPLVEVLRVRGWTGPREEAFDGVDVPLSVMRPDGQEARIGVHHPLVAPLSARRATAPAGRSEHNEIDTFALAHDLPSAVRSLEPHLSGEPAHE